jgi:hypothetical protein
MTSEVPLFACNVFCRFSLRDKIPVLETRGVHSIFGRDRPIAIPEAEIEQLKEILRLDYEVEPSATPAVGQTVALIADKAVRGVLVEKGEICRVVICLNSMGRPCL